MSNRSRSAFEAAAARLRDLVLATAPGGQLGSEESLIEMLGVSRVTIRQIARLLEREGLLRVRRGISGGYFADRPTLGTVEEAASAYLDTLEMDPNDVTVVASVLWVEVVRKAAALGSSEAVEVGKRFRNRLAALRQEAPFHELLTLQQDSQAEIFALTNARYIELIFQINSAFARKRYAPLEAPDEVAHRALLDAWRNAKSREFEAIMEGDPELGALAARRSRDLWQQLVWVRNAVMPAGSDRSL